MDNTVSVHGGAIEFTKAVKGRDGGMEGLHGLAPFSLAALMLIADICLPHSFKSIRFLLTDTKVPRDTKTLVAGVARRKLEVRSSLSFPFASRI